MNTLPLFSFICLICICLSCRTAKVTVLQDDGGNFQLNRYSSFDFLETDAEGALTGFYEEHLEYLKEEIAQQMEGRGLKRDQENPELNINIGVVVEEKAQTRETGLVTDPGTFNYIGQRRYTWRSETIEVGRYRQGTATLHLVDASKQEAVWVGVLEEVLSDRPDKIRTTIREGVGKMFAKVDEYNF